MAGMKKIAAALAAAGLLASGAAQATLLDRGGGLIYDNVLDITWLQDANYAKTSGFDTDGLMNWSTANAWAAGLNYFDSVRGVTWSDWRLPTVNPVGASFNYAFSNNGTTDFGYGITSPHSELSYMYYVNLGNLGGCTPNNADPISCVLQPGFGLAHTGLFNNLQSNDYWYGTAYAPAPASSAWLFETIVGGQVNGSQNNQFLAWAVRPGDVAAVATAAVPEPVSLALFGLGLTGLAMTRRRRIHGAS